MDEGGSAQTAVPPLIGVPADVDELLLPLLLLLQPATTSASAAMPAASRRARNLDRDLLFSARTSLTLSPAPTLEPITLRDRYRSLQHEPARAVQGVVRNTHSWDAFVTYA